MEQKAASLRWKYQARQRLTDPLMYQLRDFAVEILLTIIQRMVYSTIDGHQMITVQRKARVLRDQLQITICSADGTAKVHLQMVAAVEALIMQAVAVAE